MRPHAAFLVVLTCSLLVSVATGEQTRAEQIEERLQQFYERAPEADTNGDGRLTRAEWDAFRKVRDETLRKRFAVELERSPNIDTNRDGEVSMTEWTAFQKKRRDRQQEIETNRAAWLAEHPKTFADLTYGDHERQRLDLWQADRTPAPVAIYIHGGGWVAGSKDRVTPAEVDALLEAGISVAAINYRYSTIAPFPAPIHDAARAVQYLRLNHRRLGIDPDRIACFGGSAGAASSVWIALHDDLADPGADDPVLRESSRLTCAGGYVGPTTVDLDTLNDWFGREVPIHPAIYPLLGVPEGTDLSQPGLKAIAKEASAITHLTADDPPIMLDYRGRDKTPAKLTAGDVVHHAIMGQRLKAAADPIGTDVTVVSDRPRSPEEELRVIRFLIERLTAK